MEQMDPDNDGFNMSFDIAEKLNKTMNILHFIRKHILSNNSKLFYNGLSSLIESTSNQNSGHLSFSGVLPSSWDCNTHDKGILNAVADNGLNFLNSISNNQNYYFGKLKISYDEALNRVNYLCEFFRDFTSGNKNKKKILGNYLDSFNAGYNIITNSTNNIQAIQPANSSFNDLNKLSNPNTLSNRSNINNINNSSSNRTNNTNTPATARTLPSSSFNNKKKTGKPRVNKDENGNIIYPIIINSSLQILNLGKINCEKSFYHSEKNLFPVGFKSIREHSSIMKLGERALYTCEILDGGLKPIYKITPHEDPENPIIKDSSTGCWVKKTFFIYIFKLNKIKYN